MHATQIDCKVHAMNSTTTVHWLQWLHQCFIDSDSTTVHWLQWLHQCFIDSDSSPEAAEAKSIQTVHFMCIVTIVSWLALFFVV